MAKGHLSAKTLQNMKGTELTRNKMETAKKLGRMGLSLLESSKKDSKMAKEFFGERTEALMKANFSIITFMDLEDMNEVTAESMKDNEKTQKCMEKELFIGQMAESMTENSKPTLNMAKAN